MTVLNISSALLERVNAAIEDIRNGKMVILVDDEDRENEGDLTMAAQFATKEAINFMATHGRGLICLTMTEDQIERLGLPMMQTPGRSGPSLGTAFTVSIEARQGVTTGISAADRAHTVRVAANPECRPEDLVTPGHIFPLRAKKGGVLVRTGQTEGSVDLARLAGLTPAGVICEIMNEDGSMARMPELERVAKTHGLRILSVADLIEYRLQTESLVHRIAFHEVVLDQTGTTWSVHAYESTIHRGQFLALVKGTIDAEVPMMCRVHTGSTVNDVFASPAKSGGRILRECIDRIEKEGRGVVVYLPHDGNVIAEVGALAQPRDTVAVVDADPLREFGLGAQVLADIGVRKIRLLTNNPRKIAALSAFGLSVESTQAVEP